MSSSVRKVVLVTGNIIEMDDLIRQATQTTTDELRGSIKTTLNAWEGNEAGEGVDVVTINGPPRRPPPQEDKEGTKTTVKLFLSSTDAKQVQDAIKTVSTGLDLPRIDSVIVSPPDVSDDVTLSSLEPMWRALEDAVHSGAVSAIGLADLPTRVLLELYQWAKVKPTTIQVSLSTCCVVPKDLTTFAQQHDIQLLTHNDPAEIIDEDMVSSITSRLGVGESQWQVEWIARHRIIQHCRGLIQDKGYTLALACDG